MIIQYSQVVIVESFLNNVSKWVNISNEIINEYNNNDEQMNTILN